MASSRSKREKPTIKNGNIEHTIDNLPDGVRCHILSLLPTKYSVGTEILSKNWKGLWKFSPNFFFDDRTVFRPRRSDRLNKPTRNECFVNFVDKVLARRWQSDIEKFMLICSHYYEPSHIISWIRTAVQHHVQDLCVAWLVQFHGIPLPPSLFSCDTLVTLRVVGAIVLLTLPDTVCLPKLKTLELSYLHYSSQLAFDKFLSGCPKLENLFMMRKLPDGLSTLNIIKRTLKALSIRYGSYTSSLIGRKNQVIIDAPNLELLNIEDHVSEYLLKVGSSISKANIDVGQIYAGLDQFTLGSSVIKLLQAADEVNFLYLSSTTIKILSNAECYKLPEFDVLTHLALSVGELQSWKFLFKFICSTIYLKYLCFPDGLGSIDENELKVSPSDYMPICFTQQLKEIVIKEFEGRPAELNFVEFFLKNCKVLESLEIGFGKTKSKGDMVSSARCQILGFPKRSNNCKIVFV